MKFEISHTFKNISVDRYTKLFFDDAFNDAIKPIAGLKSREVLEKRDEGPLMHRRTRVIPDRDFPGPMKALLKGGELSYEETTTMDWNRRIQTFSSKLNFTDKIKIGGEIHFTEAPNGGTKRTLYLDVTANIFGLGGMIETKTKENLIETYNKIARFTQQWIDDGKAPA
ncbi:MAG: DUF2505 family protein [Deltaproteobacteria bacterium]|nr:DUF2505 family protein [Deltaproteobacteria bacterium]